MVSTLDFESNNPSSILGMSFFDNSFLHSLNHKLQPNYDENIKITLIVNFIVLIIEYINFKLNQKIINL